MPFNRKIRYGPFIFGARHHWGQVTQEQSKETFIQVITDPKLASQYALDPLLKIDLDKAIRFYQLISRMTKQAA